MKNFWLAALLALAAARAGAAPSTWVYYGIDGKLAYQTWSNGNRIMDFSHAGYMGGGVALPDVATVQTLNPSGGDDRTALQNAINAVAARPLVNGFRGALQLGPGTFLVSGQLNLNASGVVVRGSGSGTNGTTIVMNNAASFTLFSVTGSGSPSQSGTVSITDAYVPSGTNAFHVSSAAGFNVGDTVMVRRTVTSNWVHYLGMDTLVRSGATQTWISVGAVLTTDRKIKQISGSQITLDAPLTDSFDTNYLGTPAGGLAHYSFSGRISQVGLEHLRIQAPAVSVGYSAINCDNLIDSWVRDVAIQDGVNNVNFDNHAKRITCDSVVITHTVVQTSSAAPADFACTGTQVLFNKCQSFGTGSWPFISRSQGTGPIVFLNCSTTQDRGVAPHERWTTGILTDNCSLPHAQSSGSKEGIAYGNRGTDGSGHGWTTGWSVGWNVTSPFLLADAAPGTENWCIGGVGAKGSSSDPHGIYESLGAKVDLGQTGSLYLEQLRERLGDQALVNIGYATPVTLTVTPPSQIVLPGSNVNYTVSLTSSNAFTNAVFGVNGLPPGISAAFAPPSISSNGNSTLTLTASNSAAFGVAAFNVTATSSNFSQSVPATLIVGDFQVSAAPASQIVVHGSNAVYTVTVTTNSAFTGSVTLGVSGLPPGATAGFVPPTLSGSGNSTLTITTSTNDPGATYLLTITGADAAGSANAIASLTVSGDLASPGLLVWKGTNNWSVSLNWTNATSGGAGAPGISNDVLFADLATVPGSNTVDSLVDGDTTINSLTFTNAAGFHTVQINPGRTLTIVGANGYQNTPALNVGMDVYPAAAANVRAGITGSGGTLAISNAANSLQVRQGFGSGTVGTMALLDLSGLGTFSADLRRIQLGVESGTPRRVAGVVYLARTNTIVLEQALDVNTTNWSSGTPSLVLGHNTNSGNTNGSALYLGITNAIFVNHIVTGRGNQTNNLIAFNPAFLANNPSLYLRGSDGVGRVGQWVIADNSAGSLAAPTSGTNDFTGGAIDARVDRLLIGRGRTGTTVNSGIGTLTFNAGTIDANLLRLGTMIDESTSTNASGIGTANVNGSATLIVNTVLELAHTNTTAIDAPAAVAATRGTLNLNGGTVQATNILGAGGAAIINLNSGTLDLQPDWATAPGVIANLSTLNIGAAGVTPAALLLDAAIISTTNTITIASNGVLAGNTIVTSPGLIVNGTISPGDGVGAMTNNGAATFGGGGRFAVEINDAAAGPGIGWDFLSVTRGINISAAGANPFVIALQSLDSDEPGPAANFSNDASYEWMIAAAGDAVTNFDAARFAIDNTAFANDLAGGNFFLKTNAGALVLAFTNNHPPAATATLWYAAGGVTAIPVSALASHWSDPDADAVQFVSADSSSANGSNNVGAGGGFIFYTNAAALPDTIGYTVADVRAYRPGDTVRTATGVIQIVPPPSIAAVGVANGNLILSSTNGIPGGGYAVLTATNLSLPVSQWTSAGSGFFDGAGSLHFTNAIGAAAQQFYLLQAQ